MARWRIVREAGGRGRIQLIPGRCSYLVGFAEPCREPVRIAPGAVFCEMHKEYENAGCAEHDKRGCTHPDCTR